MERIIAVVFFGSGLALIIFFAEQLVKGAGGTSLALGSHRFSSASSSSASLRTTWLWTVHCRGERGGASIQWDPQVSRESHG
jgi:hypothetical protein